MKLLLVLTLNLYLCFSGWGKDKNKWIVIQNSSDSTLDASFGKFQGAKWDTLELIKISPRTTHKIAIQDLDTGLYILSDKQNVQRNFFVSKAEDIAIDFQFAFGIGSLKVNSYENNMLDSLRSSAEYLTMEADMVLGSMSLIARTNKRYYSLTDSLFSIREVRLLKLNEAVRKFQSNNPSSIALRTFSPLFLLPCRGADPKLLKNYQTEESFLIDHYWDYLQECNRHIINHPHFYSKVNEYFFKYAEKSPEKLLEAGDLILSNVDHNPQSRAYVVKHILILFSQNTNEDFFLAASEHYLNSCENEEAYADERKNIERIKKLQVGLKAPDISLFQPDGSKVKLSSFKGETVVLIFWATWCPHCLQELPGLLTLSENMHSEHVRFVAISLDEDKSEWISAIQVNRLSSWTHSCEFRKWKSEATEEFNIHRTPSIYVIHTDGTIKAKDILPRDLSLYLKDSQ